MSRCAVCPSCRFQFHFVIAPSSSIGVVVLVLLLVLLLVIGPNQIVRGLWCSGVSKRVLFEHDIPIQGLPQCGAEEQKVLHKRRLGHLQLPGKARLPGPRHAVPCGRVPLQQVDHLYIYLISASHLLTPPRTPPYLLTRSSHPLLQR